MRYLYALIVISLLGISCGKEEIKDPVKLLQRKWVLSTDTSQFLHISIKNGLNVFSMYKTPESFGVIEGTWYYENNALIIESASKELVHGAIDSIAFIRDSLDSYALLFSQKKEIFVISDEGVSCPAAKKVYEIKEITDSKLILKSENEILEFKYIPPVLISQFSWESVFRGILGLFVLVVICYLLSTNRKKIDWKIVFTGIALQLLFALGVLKVPFVESIFEGISRFFLGVVEFTKAGTTFLFKNFDSGVIESPLVSFVFMVLPTVIFFSALTSLFFYWGILQKIVYGIAWVMKKFMRLSGAESMAAAGNIFLGQTEAPLLIKPYLGQMTRSEIMCLMTGGMATIAGGVLAAYVGFLGGDDPVQQLYFAKHLLAASVMSAPAAIVAAKLLVPETEEFNNEMKIPKEKIGTNALEAVANGTTEGLKLAANVAAMLLVFTALVAMANWILSDFIGANTGLNEYIKEVTDGKSKEFTLQFIFGYAFAPLAWLMGVPSDDIVIVGQLMGEKTVINEFFAYTSLGEMKNAGMFSSEKSIIMVTYILCGFSNFASIGIQIGGIGSLAPGKKATLSQLGFRALIGGTIACLFTAVIVGMLM
ncbi:MAG: NupC/NupG family nucleoside CNT transporter [Bacteroidota bacterium]